jgi:hypothetical protein
MDADQSGWSEWLLDLRGVEGCLYLLARNPDAEHTIAILHMLGDTVGRVAKGMEEARDMEIASARGAEEFQAKGRA